MVSEGMVISATAPETPPVRSDDLDAIVKQIIDAFQRLSEERRG